MQKILKYGCCVMGLTMVFGLSGCETNKPQTPPPQKTVKKIPVRFEQIQIDDTYKSVGQDSRVKQVVIHYTAADFQSSVNILTNGKVSSHYLINNSPPTIYRLVPEDKRAWHAGISNWYNTAGLNNSSIGIELVNLGYVDGPSGREWHPFSQAQIQSLIRLLRDIKSRYDISPDDIVGHNEIAPQRKFDPGPLFPWKELADAGLVRWPNPSLVRQYENGFLGRSPDATWFQNHLSEAGYPIQKTGTWDKQTQNVISAFQTRYRPSNYSGQPDIQTAALLQALTAEHREE